MGSVRSRTAGNPCSPGAHALKQERGAAPHANPSTPERGRPWHSEGKEATIYGDLQFSHVFSMSEIIQPPIPPKKTFHRHISRYTFYLTHRYHPKLKMYRFGYAFSDVFLSSKFFPPNCSVRNQILVVLREPRVRWIQCV